jgi:ABC-type molybdate transport system substrate-binding protein
LLKNASPTTIAFYSYLQGEKARAVFGKHGYGVPQ